MRFLSTKTIKNSFLILSYSIYIIGCESTMYSMADPLQATNQQFLAINISVHSTKRDTRK